MSRILVVYYSVSNGNTREIAHQMAEYIKADLAEIQTVQPYDGSYQEVVDQGKQEVQRSYRPPIRPLPFRPEDYDIIAIGTPTWWYTMAPAMATFFSLHEWAGKTIIPFNVHNGSRFSRTIQTIEELEPDATVIEDGFTVSEQTVAEAAPDVAEWLANLGY